MNVTFVVTTYQRPEWLRQCLASIPSEAKVVVVDDELEGLGFARARLQGLGQVQTEWYAFLDDDDVLLPNWLAEHEALAMDADVVAGSYLETDAELRPLRTLILRTPTIRDFEAHTCPVNDGALVRRSVLERITWHPELGTAFMFSLWHDLLVSGARFAATSHPTWLHRLHGSNMSATAADADLRELALT